MSDYVTGFFSSHLTGSIDIIGSTVEILRKERLLWYILPKKLTFSKKFYPTLKLTKIQIINRKNSPKRLKFLFKIDTIIYRTIWHFIANPLFLENDRFSTFEFTASVISDINVLL